MFGGDAYAGIGDGEGDDAFRAGGGFRLVNGDGDSSAGGSKFDAVFHEVF